jgi:signal transduction histidine kinase
MRLRDLSIRVKVAITILGALTLGLGLATMFSLRFWEREQNALTTDHALMVAATARASVETALAHGQIGAAREQLDRIALRPPVEAYRIVSRDGIVLMSSSGEEEGHQRPGAVLPNPWDIPAQGMVVGRPGTSELGVVVPVSGIAGMGSRGALELIVGGGPIERSIKRARTFGLTITLVLGLAYAVVLGAMMEREVIGPFHRLEQLAADQQAQLTQRAGFAEVGALASEVAHEIKRPLAGIRGALELIEQEYAISDSERRLLGQVESELTHVDSTVRDLLALARPVGLDKQPVDIRTTIDAALVRLSGLPGADRVAIVREVDRDLPTIPGDAGRLEQAVLNLCVNAVEAMSEGGQLTVAAHALGAAVEVAVSDTGPGIPAEIRASVLKPFFSTKTQGTGLGLPLVARVVAAHGGQLSFESAAGRGTTFRLRFPTEVPAWPVNAS